MRFVYQYLFSLHLYVSIRVNYFLADAKPLIGETVTRALDNEFPSVVSLATVPATNESDHFCTGTLISKKHVLTCAHCIEIIRESDRSWKTPSNVLVSVGSTDMTKGIKHQVAAWKSFDKWVDEKNITVIGDPDIYHDIAVITLTKDVENGTPAHLSRLRFGGISGKTVVTAGWGSVTNSGDKSRFLHSANLRVIERETCLMNLIAWDDPPDYVLNHFCTVGESKSTAIACGDSGGPMFTGANELVGVNDAACGISGHPKQQNLHLPIKIYRKFIKAIIHPSRSSVANIVYNIDKFYV